MLDVNAKCWPGPCKGRQVEALPLAGRAKDQTLTPLVGKTGPVVAAPEVLAIGPLKSPGIKRLGYVGSGGSIVTGIPCRNTSN